MGEPKTTRSKSNGKIQVTKNGPYMVLGNIPLYRMVIKCDHSIMPSEWTIAEKLKTPSNYALCRCGGTGNKPFCDGTHVKKDFNGTETSKNIPFEAMAKPIEGPKITLKDAEILCASARFCHRNGDIWDQIAQTNEAKIKENCIENACTCPSGRLVIVDKKTNQTVEPKLDQTIGLIEDPSIGRDGPLWVRGNIQVYSAEDKLYEIRNRMTLCRCGKSSNKPFCDSTHYPEEDQTERKK
jgi:CDGSH-type Zn-finger protein